MRVRRIASALMAVVATGGITIGLTMSAGASGPPYKSFGITVNPSSPSAGERVTVTARGFQPGHEVTVFISTSCGQRSCSHLNFIRLGETDANANGVATDKVSIPKSFGPGSTHVLRAVGTDHGRGLTESTTVTLSKHHHAGTAG